MKKIFILKWEPIFPELRQFEGANNFLWTLELNKIKKLLSKEDIKVISLEKIDFKKSSEFVDYVNLKKFSFKPYNEYLESLNVAKRGLEKLEKKIKINLVDSLTEPLTYDLIKPLQDINLVKEIIERENPSEVISNSKGSFANIIKNECKKKNIPFTKINCFGTDQLNGVISYLRNALEVNLRFGNLPFIKRKEFKKTKKETSKKRFIFCAFDGYYSDRLSPIYYGMKNEEFSVLIRDFRMISNLEDKGIHYNTFGDFLTSFDKKEIKNKIKKIKKELRKNLNLFEYKGESLKKNIEKNLFYFLLNKISYLLYYQKAIKNMEEIEKRLFVLSDNAILPDIVIAKNSDSIVIQNGIYSDPTGRGIIPLFSKNIAIWGKDVKKYSKEIGEKGIVTGNIRLDKYKKIPKTKKEKYIILATQAFDGYSSLKEKKILLKKSISAIKYFPKRKLIIKSHPRDNVKWIRQEIKNNQIKNVFLEEKIPTEELLPNCEAIITTNSTLILDSMILGKPVIIFNPINRPEIIDFYDSVVKVKNDDLISAIKKLDNPKINTKLLKNSKKFLEGYCYKIDGLSSDRIIKLIRDKNEKN